jgi:hypothetical protein
MAQVQPTLSVTVDEVTFQTSELSPSVQQLVAILDDWRQGEADAQSELLKHKAALRDLQREIYTTILQEREAAAESAEPVVVEGEAVPAAE